MLGTPWELSSIHSASGTATDGRDPRVPLYQERCRRLFMTTAFANSLRASTDDDVRSNARPDDPDHSNPVHPASRVDRPRTRGGEPVGDRLRAGGSAEHQ